MVLRWSCESAEPQEAGRGALSVGGSLALGSVVCEGSRDYSGGQ